MRTFAPVGLTAPLGQMASRMEAEAVLDAPIPRVAEIRLTGAPVPRLNNTLRTPASLPVEAIANGDVQ